MVLFSVVVPAYNEAKYLPRALSSIYYSALCLCKGAPWATVEIIVVDNGSVDGTAAVAKSYGARVVTEPEPGIARARNAGAKAANGALLAFIDSDYRVPHDFLQTVSSRFAADRALSAAGVKVQVEPSEAGPLSKRIAQLGLWGGRRVKRMAFGIFIVRRPYFERLAGFDERLYAYEDVDMLKRIARDARAGTAKYEIVESITVHTSARGLYRGGMLSAYALIAISPRARRDPARCDYWYDR